MKLRTAVLFGISAIVLAGCVDGTSSSSSSYDRHVTIINNTNSAIREFYGSNAGVDSWQEDILGSDILPAGSSVKINFDDGSGYCTFDFKAVFVDGSSLVDSNVDVCTTATVEFH
jgi:hypothetical protein